MDRCFVVIRPFLVLVLAAHALALTGCKAKCLPGHKLVGKSCVRISAEDAGGRESDAAIADAGADDAATATATSAQTASDGSAGAAATSVTGTPAGASGSAGSAGQEAANGGAGGSAGGSADAAAAQQVPCDTEGATRCAPDGAQGTRETCMGMVWVASAPCAEAETCVMQGGSAECAAVEKLCVGSNGQPVCDQQGTMLLCNEDGTVRSQEMCTSSKLCQAGIAAGVCATCIANEEYRCTDKALELCGSDGMSFAMQEECETAALCNPSVGKCTAAACDPGAFSCAGNTLKVCNADGTGFDESRSMPCGSGTCDATGKDCNMCEPGMRTCMDDVPVVCDATGQSFEPMPCRSGMHCVGAGNCVECERHDQCSDEANGCQEARCQRNACTTMAARNGKACGGSSSCQDGECCTPNCRNKCGGAPDGCGGTCDAVCPPRCGNGIIEGNEICDGNCPTTCPDDGNECTRNVPQGMPCMIECVEEIIETGVQNACRGCGTLRYTGTAAATGTEIDSYCQVGMGACFATGTIQCRTRPGNELFCTANGSSPTAEVCNGIDDDCDGVPDEDADASCPAGMRCASGYGMCEPIP